MLPTGTGSDCISRSSCHTRPPAQHSRRALELRTLSAVLRARYKLIIAVIALAVVGALASSLASAKAYDSQAKVIVGQSLSAVNPDLNQLAASEQLSATYAQIATTRPILQ